MTMKDFDETMIEKKPFELTYGTDGVYLTVNRIFDITVQEEEVLNEIRRKKIRNYNAAVISDTVKKASGKPVRIADKQEEEKIDAVVEIITSPDKMKAYIKIKPPEGGANLPGFRKLLTI